MKSSWSHQIDFSTLRFGNLREDDAICVSRHEIPGGAELRQWCAREGLVFEGGTVAACVGTSATRPWRQYREDPDPIETPLQRFLAYCYLHGEYECPVCTYGIDDPVTTQNEEFDR